jgi:hypothetical protein
MPVLWAVQTTLIGAPAPLLALLSRRRLVVTVAMGLLPALVLVGAAWVFFVHAGLPLRDGTTLSAVSSCHGERAIDVSECRGSIGSAGMARRWNFSSGTGS